MSIARSRLGGFWWFVGIDRMDFVNRQVQDAPGNRADGAEWPLGGNLLRFPMDLKDR
jgi:hypothetical protein